MSTQRFLSQKLTLFLGAAVFSLVLVAPASAQSLRGKEMMKRPLSTPSARIVNACQSREEAVKKHLTQLTKLVTNMLSVFDRHATRVQTFYTSTLVPAGKVLPNYEALVADIQTKRAAVEKSLDEAEAGAADFSCTSGDPKQLLTDYRVDMQATKNALKVYRTSIKNLIVAVGTLLPEESPKPTPTPVATPSPTPTPAL
jgi:hypothetical protein